MKKSEMVAACLGRDKRYRGRFYLAVKSTGILCHPDCSTQVPLEKNMVFFDTLEMARNAGYRPCKISMKEEH